MFKKIIKAQKDLFIAVDLEYDAAEYLKPSNVDFSVSSVGCYPVNDVFVTVDEGIANIYGDLRDRYEFFRLTFDKPLRPNKLYAVSFYLNDAAFYDDDRIFSLIRTNKNKREPLHFFSRTLAPNKYRWNILDVDEAGFISVPKLRDGHRLFHAVFLETKEINFLDLLLTPFLSTGYSFSINVLDELVGI